MDWLWFKRNLAYNLTLQPCASYTDVWRVCCHCVLSECARPYLTEMMWLTQCDVIFFWLFYLHSVGGLLKKCFLLISDRLPENYGSLPGSASVSYQYRASAGSEVRDSAAVGSGVASARITNKVMGAEYMASEGEPENFFGGWPPKGSPEIAKNRLYCCRQWLQNIDSFQVIVIEFVITHINWTTNGAISKQAHLLVLLALKSTHTRTNTL